MIRRAQIKDIPQIDELLSQVLEIHHEGRPDLFKGNTRKYTDKELEEIINDDRRPIFVEEENDEIRGYAFCIFQQILSSNILTDILTLYIDDLVVRDTCRGQGIGRKLYEYVKQYASDCDCHNLTLNVWAFNEKAWGFYENMGLKPQKVYLEEILEKENSK